MVTAEWSQLSGVPYIRYFTANINVLSPSVQSNGILQPI